MKNARTQFYLCLLSLLVLFQTSLFAADTYSPLDFDLVTREILRTQPGDGIRYVSVGHLPVPWQEQVGKPGFCSRALFGLAKLLSRRLPLFRNAHENFQALAKHHRLVPIKPANLTYLTGGMPAFPVALHDFAGTEAPAAIAFHFDVGQLAEGKASEMTVLVDAPASFFGLKGGGNVRWGQPLTLSWKVDDLAELFAEDPSGLVQPLLELKIALARAHYQKLDPQQLERLAEQIRRVAEIDYLSRVFKVANFERWQALLQQRLAQASGPSGLPFVIQEFGTSDRGWITPQPENLADAEPIDVDAEFGDLSIRAESDPRLRKLLDTTERIINGPKLVDFAHLTIYPEAGEKGLAWAKHLAANRPELFTEDELHTLSGWESANDEFEEWREYFVIVVCLLDDVRLTGAETSMVRMGTHRLMIANGFGEKAAFLFGRMQLPPRDPEITGSTPRSEVTKHVYGSRLVGNTIEHEMLLSDLIGNRSVLSQALVFEALRALHHPVPEKESSIVDPFIPTATPFRE